MNDAITIRVANTTDAGNLCTFMSALITERLLVLFRRERYPTVDKIRALIGKMPNACYGVLLIAETQGTVVGMLDFHVIRDVRLSLSGRFGMSVAHSWRRKGVATNLLRELLTWSESHENPSTFFRCHEPQVESQPTQRPKNHAHHSPYWRRRWSTFWRSQDRLHNNTQRIL